MNEEERADFKGKFDRVIADMLICMESRAMSPAPEPSRNTEIGPVYFFRCGPYIKIGYSIDPLRRLREIRTGIGTKVPDDIDRTRTVLVQTEPGGRNRERDLHKQFKHLHHWGEWFTEAPELTEYIESLSERKPGAWPSRQPKSRPATSNRRGGSRFTTPPAQLFTKQLPRLR